MSEYKTSPFLTKFEFCRIIGIRSLQLSMKKDGTDNVCDFHKMAQSEILNRKLDMTIRRYLPNGDYEDRRLKELELDFMLTIC